MLFEDKQIYMHFALIKLSKICKNFILIWEYLNKELVNKIMNLTRHLMPAFCTTFCTDSCFQKVQNPALVVTQCVSA